MLALDAGGLLSMMLNVPRASINMLALDAGGIVPRARINMLALDAGGIVPRASTNMLALDAGDLTEAELRSELAELRGRLAASPAILEDAVRHASEGPSCLTADDLACESLLCSRFVCGLGKVCVKPSTIPGAGNGVFACEDIDVDEIITCYPGDAVTYGAAASSSRGTYWGAHVPDELRVITPEDEDYALSVEAGYAVVGLKQLDADMSYVGHLVNDGAAILRGLGPEIALVQGPAYMRASERAMNAGHSHLDRCHVVVTATRPIARGEECFVSYGPRYWTSRLMRRNAYVGAVLSSLF